MASTKPGKPQDDTTTSRSRRRMERANVRKRLQGVFMRCPALAAKDIRVYNISELGIGVETAPIGKSPEPNETLDAKLVVGKTVAPVKIRLVHMTSEATGFAFADPSDLVRGAIRSYFETELVGAALRPSPDNPSTVSLGSYALKFESADGNRLQVQMEGQRVGKFTFEILGNHIEWSEGGSLQLIQNSRREPASEFLLKQLVKLVQSADSLDPGVQGRLERILQMIPQE